MKQHLLKASCAIIAMLFCAELVAQDWVDFPTSEEESEHLFQRGPGYYLSILKIVLVLPFLFLWIKMADWVNRDSEMIEKTTGIKGEIWNPIVVFTFLFGLFFVLFFPWFFISYPFYVLCAVAPTIAYIFTRNSQVNNPEDRVFTKGHVANKWREQQVGEGEVYEAPLAELTQDQGPQVDFKALGPDHETRQHNLIAVRQNPSFPVLKQLFFNAVQKRSEQVSLVYTQDRVNVHFQIDGISYPISQMDRRGGDQLLSALKTLGNLNPADRRSAQQAQLEFSLSGVDKRCLLKTQGTKTGETAILLITEKKARSWSLDDVGMSAAMQARLKELMSQRGYGIVTTLPRTGLSTTWQTVLDASDRVTREVVGLAPREYDELPIENIGFHDITAESFAGVFKELLLKETEVFICPDPISGDVINLLCEAINNPKKTHFVASRIQSKSATEALLRMLQFKCDRKSFAKAVTFVLNQRLARRLCNSCKQPLAPNPELWKKLGIAASAKPPTLFAPYQAPPITTNEKGEPIVPPVCPACGGMGYLGRIAIFELLEVDDLLRKTLVTQPKLDALNAAAKKTNHQTIQMQGIQLLAQGIISIPELQRILKL